MLYTGTGLCVILANVLVNSTKFPIFCDTSMVQITIHILGYTFSTRHRCVEMSI